MDSTECDEKAQETRLKKVLAFRKQALFLLPLNQEHGSCALFLESLKGAVAQLVEQRTENPCVGGSIPPHTTKISAHAEGFFISLMRWRRSMYAFCNLFDHFFIEYFEIFRASTCHQSIINDYFPVMPVCTGIF